MFTSSICLFLNGIRLGFCRLFLGRDLIAGIDRLFVLSLLAGSKTKESGAR